MEQVLLSAAALVSNVDTGLRVTVFNSTTLTPEIRVRFITLDEKGETVESFVTFTAGSQSSSVQPIANLGKSRLVSVTIDTTEPDIQRGELYALLQFTWGTPANTPNLVSLLSGYISQNTPLIYPLSPGEVNYGGFGAPTQFQGTNPPAGDEIDFTISNFQYTEILGGTFILLTSAVAGNRTVRFDITAGNGFSLSVISRSTQAAGTSRIYQFWIGPNLPTDFDNIIYIPLPHGINLRAFQLATTTTNIDVGDNWSSPVVTYRSLVDLTAF